MVRSLFMLVEVANKCNTWGSAVNAISGGGCHQIAILVRFAENEQ